MSDEAQVEVTVETNKSGKMSALRGRYGKDANCGDPVAEALKGADLAALTAFANSVGVDTDKYAALNNGQRRMNVGNRLRHLIKKGEVTIDQLNAVARAEPKAKPVKAEPGAAETVQ